MVTPGFITWCYLLHSTYSYDDNQNLDIIIHRKSAKILDGMTQRASWFFYILLILFPFVLFAPIILTGKAIFWGTPLTQFIPWWKEAWDLILQGELPLWNPLLGMGAPLLANYQSAIFYPPTWIYFLLYLIGGVSVMAWGQAILIVAHLAWAGIGMVFLIRQLRLGSLAQIIGGLAFSLSGYLISRAGFLSINAATAWIPWIIFGLIKLFDAYTSKSPVSDNHRIKDRQQSIIAGYLLFVFSLGMQLLAGHAQTTWYTFLLTLSWMFYLIISKVISVRRSNSVQDFKDGSGEVDSRPAETKLGSENHPRKHVTRFRLIVILFMTALLFAVGIAAIQLIPTAEYLLHSQRSTDVSYDFAVSYSFWPWHFLTLIAPGLFGSPVIGDYWGYANYWEDAVYIGLLPLIMALSVIIKFGRGKQKKKYAGPGFIGFLLGIILITFLLALGRNTPIYPWLYNNVPTFDMFQAPTRITILAVFSLSLLAAIGVDSWRRPREKWMYWLRLGVMAGVAITLGAIAAMMISQSFEWRIRPSFIRATALLGFWGVVLGVLALQAPVKGGPQFSYGKWGRWQWAVILFVATDLVVAGWGLNPGIELSVYSTPSPTLGEVQGKLKSGRLYLPADEEEILKFKRFLRFDTFHPFENNREWDNLRAVFLPNVSVIDEIPSANNFDPLLPGRYVNWSKALDEVETGIRDQMLNLMGITVVERIDSGEPFGVRFDSRSSFARYRWVPCGCYVENEIQSFDLIKSGGINLQQIVILEGSSELDSEECGGDSSAEIQLDSERINKFIFLINSPEPGYIVLADVWYPEWKAWIDGGPTPILNANYLFRAVAIPAGEHELTIEYRPVSFYLGIGISGGLFLTLIILFVYWYLKKREIRRAG